MLVQRILDFIKNLEREDKPIPCDVVLRESLWTRFSYKPSSVLLDADDIEFLIECFKNRWEAIVDSKNDYTLNPSTVNLSWINLAKDLEVKVPQLGYLKILIPKLINDRDFNDFTALIETVNLFNFYLGRDGCTLFRKWSLCEHLKNHDFFLSTHRSFTNRKLSIVSIDELARLKQCKQTSRQVSIGSEIFDNFWDLLRKKVFVRLKDKGSLPVGLLPQLMGLIERYYFLKSAQADFCIFKNEVKNFFDSLEEYELADVNYLYGMAIEYKENEKFLLDVLISLHTAKNFFELDYDVRTLTKWLFEYNPALKVVRKELEPVYSEMHEHKESELEKKSSSDSLVQCCSFLVNLLTTKFQFSLLCVRQNISLWDITNVVYPEESSIFNQLLPFIEANQPNQLALAYANSLKKLASPVRMDINCTNLFKQYAVTNNWLGFLKRYKLSKLSGMKDLWFTPELLFYTLLCFKTNNQVSKTYIQNFLDNLIQTCAQDQNDLMKQFRVNILFVDFLNGLPENQRRNLLILLKLCNDEKEKIQFINLSAFYINERIAQFSYSPSQSGSSQFFMPLHQMENSRLFNIPARVSDIKTLIIEYKTQLANLNVDYKCSAKISDYLRKISQPILTEVQKEMIKTTEMNMDYLGQYN